MTAALMGTKQAADVRPADSDSDDEKEKAKAKSAAASASAPLHDSVPQHQQIRRTAKLLASQGRHVEAEKLFIAALSEYEQYTRQRTAKPDASSASGSNSAAAEVPWYARDQDSSALH
jgi:hypothetical protein